METPEDVLDRIARSDDAVMAIDYGDRIVLWNKRAERLFERPARSVLGKLCYEIMGGRDVHGNLYCYRACPVAHQARDVASDPVHTFSLDVQTGSGKPRRVECSLFAIPSSRPSLSTVVHVFREPEREPSPLVEELGRVASPPSPPLFGIVGKDAPVELTPREREVLRKLSEGLSTAAVARQLKISAVTVRNHVQSILQKLEVHSKIAAVAYAYQHNLV